MIYAVDIVDENVKPATRTNPLWLNAPIPFIAIPIRIFGHKSCHENFFWALKVASNQPGPEVGIPFRAKLGLALVLNLTYERTDQGLDVVVLGRAREISTKIHENHAVGI